MKRRPRFRLGFEFYLLVHRCAAVLFLSVLVLSLAYHWLVLRPHHEAQLLTMHRQAQQLPLVHRQIHQDKKNLERLQLRLAQSSSLLEVFELPSGSSSLMSFNRSLRASAASHKLKIVSLRQSAAERFTPSFGGRIEHGRWQRVPIKLSLSAGWSDYLAFVHDLSSWRLWMDVIDQHVQARPDGRLSIDLSLYLYAQAPPDEHA